MAKVIYVLERDFFRIGKSEVSFCNKLNETGFETELWSIAPITHGWSKYEDIPGYWVNAIYDKQLILYSFNSLQTEINAKKNESVVFYIDPYHGYSEVSFFLRKCLAKHSIPFINRLESPCIANGINVKKSKKGWFFTFIIPYSIRTCLSLIYQTMKLLIPFKSNDYYFRVKMNRNLSFVRFFGPIIYKSKINFVPGEICYNDFPQPLEIYSKRNILIEANYFSCFDNNSVVFTPKENEYAVFIDQGMTQYVPFHAGEELIKNKEQFLKNINSFFDLFETQMKLKILIAVHPKANYAEYSPYGKRELISGLTKELIEKAKIVIVMNSTSINWAVFYKKPILFLTSDEYAQKSWYMVDNYLKTIFHTKQYNISSVENLNMPEYITEYNEPYYEKYKNLYMISANAVQRPFFDVFVSEAGNILTNTSKKNG